ncbi:MAG: TIGR03546 family protein [Elusimicrobia bacterium]|nr:TIGR03546 family protein [Elusimicrobiota bacterium]
MNPLRLLKDLVAALHGGADPRHLAAGFALGAAIGLIPKGNLFAVVFLLLFFALRLNKGLALMSAFFFTPVGYAVDGLAHEIGLALLKAPALAGLWTALYDLPIVPLTRFNNTVVLGNLVLGLALFAPLHFFFLRFVTWYEANLAAEVERLKAVQWLKGLRWFQVYQEWSK